MKRYLLISILLAPFTGWAQPADRTVMSSHQLPPEQEEEGSPSAHDQGRAAIFNQMILANRQQREGKQLQFVVQECGKPWSLAGLLSLVGVTVTLRQRRRRRPAA